MSSEQEEKPRRIRRDGEYADEWPDLMSRKWVVPRDFKGNPYLTPECVHWLRSVEQRLSALPGYIGLSIRGRGMRGLKSTPHMKFSLEVDVMYDSSFPLFDLIDYQRLLRAIPREEARKHDAIFGVPRDEETDLAWLHAEPAPYTEALEGDRAKLRSLRHLLETTTGGKVDQYRSLARNLLSLEKSWLRALLGEHFTNPNDDPEWHHYVDWNSSRKQPADFWRQPPSPQYLADRRKLLRKRIERVLKMKLDES